jgi:hypothetical protein
MNSNVKASNNTALDTGSFIQAPINTIKNATTNIANSIKNTVSNIMPSDISEQINDSVNATLESTPEPLVTIPVIIALGILIILFIIVIIFREQVALGLQLAWEKIKDVLGISKPDIITPVATPPQLDGPVQNQNIVEKILPGRKEVFNIAQNKYSYSDSEPLCKAFGAELASYDQVKEAWNKGADWCNYGWVKGQAAVFPTQESTFNKLQSGPEDQRMSCGVPGINGGYFDNPELKFGVNCYGVKPSENEADNRAIMNKDNLTPGAIAFDKKVFDYKKHKSEIPVNPFSSENWSS